MHKHIYCKHINKNINIHEHINKKATIKIHITFIKPKATVTPAIKLKEDQSQN